MKRSKEKHPFCCIPFISVFGPPCFQSPRFLSLRPGERHGQEEVCKIGSEDVTAEMEKD